jgi:putative hemolysin
MARLFLELFVVVVLLGINAFLAASELALVSASKPRLRSMAEEGNGSAKRALNLSETPARFLATVQIGITVAGFFAAAVGAVTLGIELRLSEPNNRRVRLVVPVNSRTTGRIACESQ